MYPRNAASPLPIDLGVVVLIADGTVQTSGISVIVSTDGGTTETAGGGTLTVGGTSKVVSYTPTQAETNYTAFSVRAYKANCFPAFQEIVTTASSVAGTTSVNNIAAGAIAAATFAANALDAVWSTATRALTDKVGFSLANGSIAAATFAAGALDAVWSTAARTLTSYGTLVADVATAVWGAATRVLTAGTNIVLAKGTGITGLNDLDASGIRGAVGMASANLDTQLGAIYTDLNTGSGALYNYLVNNLGVNGAAITALGDARISHLDANVSSRMGTFTLPTNFSELLISVSGHISNVDTLTTYTGNTPQSGDAFLRLGAPVGATVSADILSVITTLANLASTTDAANTLLDLADAIETGLTLRAYCRLTGASLLGKAAGAATTNMTFRAAVSDSKTRINATVDSIGNRSAVATDAT